ncbi:MAG TPA: hemerythrin domain-containing protein [Thermoanaerobaculia bacterium]|jgi:hemerythrin-like domain-containing protein
MAKNEAKTAAKRKGILERLAGSSESDTDGRAPLATKMLTEQHDEVRSLFKEYEGAGEGAHATRKRLIDEASQKLEVHSQLEERIFYPACEELEDEKARKMVGESLEEHLIVKRLIKELEPLKGTDEKFESKATVLMESVKHHADEEEKDLFPVAEKELEDERLRELGGEMEALKARLTSGRKAPKATARGSARA